MGGAAAAGRRPEVWANCAASADGRIAYADGARARLSSPEDLVRVHRIRAGVDGILVGVGTVRKDDPSLRVKWELVGTPPGKGPTRIVVDSRGTIPEEARVLDGSIPTIVATSRASRRTFPPHVRTLVCGEARVDLADLMVQLGRLGLQRILVEGGAEILASVLRGGLADRLTVYYAPVVVGGRTAPPMVAGGETRGPEEALGLELVAVARCGEGYVATYVPRSPPASGRPSGATVPQAGSPPAHS